MKSPLRDSPLGTLTGDLVAQFHERHPQRTGSLLITVFGDVIYPRGGAVWLSDLLALMEHFGLGQRVVRTALSRLAGDGWFDIEQMGRRSVYRLSEDGAARVRAASAQIYADPRREWTADWTVVLLADVPATGRDDVRRRLESAGLRPATANTFIAPASRDVDRALDVLQHELPLLVLDGARFRSQTNAQIQGLAKRAWGLDEIADGYEAFLTNFQDLVESPIHGEDGLDALLARILLVHHYRRLVLRDPKLPTELLPSGWSGLRAYQVVRTAYTALIDPSERAVDELLATPWGRLPPRQPSASGFGDLDRINQIIPDN